MEIFDQLEIVLRNGGYDTWQWKEGDHSAICFEDTSLIGFVHVFASASQLISEWKSAQQLLLRSYAPALRASGAKAWNVYSVFLTSDIAGTNGTLIERIEEDFTLTRKIARAGVKTADDVQHALLPLLMIRSRPKLGVADFKERLRIGLADLPTDAVTAFLEGAPTVDVSRLLGERA